MPDRRSRTACMSEGQYATSGCALADSMIAAPRIPAGQGIARLVEVVAGAMRTATVHQQIPDRGREEYYR